LHIGKYDCKICENCFDEESHLQGHHHDVHESQSAVSLETYACDFCDYTSGKGSLLVAHKKESHPMLAALIWGLCV
jgi:hypothetical protein